MLALHVPDEIATRFAPIAQAAGKTTEAYLQALFLERLEDLADAQDAERRLVDIRSGKELGLND